MLEKGQEETAFQGESHHYCWIQWRVDQKDESEHVQLDLINKAIVTLGEFQSSDNPNLRVNGGYRKSLWTVTSAMKLKDTCSLEESSDKPRQRIIKQTSPCQQWSVQSKLWFFSSHVQMWELDHPKAERWRVDAFKLWCWRSLLRVPWTARRSNLRKS